MHENLAFGQTIFRAVSKNMDLYFLLFFLIGFVVVLLVDLSVEDGRTDFTHTHFPEGLVCSSALFI